MSRRYTVTSSAVSPMTICVIPNQATTRVVLGFAILKILTTAPYALLPSAIPVRNATSMIVNP